MSRWSRTIDAALIAGLFFLLAAALHDWTRWVEVGVGALWLLTAAGRAYEGKLAKRKAARTITITLTGDCEWDEWSLAHVLSTELRRHREQTGATS